MDDPFRVTEPTVISFSGGEDFGISVMASPASQRRDA